MGALRDRCKAMNERLSRNAMLRQGSPVDDLVAFVQAEHGRSADSRLENTHALILYFGTEEDRAEFKAIVIEAKPGMIAKEIP